MILSTADDRSLAFSIEGHDGPAVVHLHGLTSSRARDSVLGLDLTRDLRADASVRVLRYDARGHGESTGGDDPDEYTWPRLAIDLLTLIDHVFPGEPVHSIGPSMGSATQLYAALEAPERFASLTLALPPTAWETRADRAATYENSASMVQRYGAASLVDALDERPPAAPPAPPTRPDVAENLLPTVLRGAARSNLPDRARLAEIGIPSLLLAWIDDPAHPLSTAQELHRLLPQSTLAVAHEVGDLVTWPGLLRHHVTQPIAAR